MYHVLRGKCMNKTLVLIRHAHRDTSDRNQDNGLSGKGKDQAKFLKKFFSSRFNAEETKGGVWLVSSPKKRCIETLEPIARHVNAEIDVHPELDEQGTGETMQAVEKRMRAFFHEWSRSSVQTTLICSHGDWLPMATQLLLGFPHEFKKGSWFELEALSHTAYLKWYIPHFKPFYS